MAWAAQELEAEEARPSDELEDVEAEHELIRAKRRSVLLGSLTSSTIVTTSKTMTVAEQSWKRPLSRQSLYSEALPSSFLSQTLSRGSSDSGA